MSSDAMQVKDAVDQLATGADAKELPPGYKQTEVGVIPEDWTAGTLGDAILALQAGVSVNSTAEKVGRGVPAILKTSCIESGRFFPHEAKSIAAKDQQRATLNPLRDSILISRMNTIDLVGECGFVDRDYPELFIPDRLWLTRLRSSAPVSPRWLTYVLSSARYRRHLQSIATGTSGSMKNIAKGSLLGLQVAYPRPREQRAIAEALSDVDGLLGALGALIAKKRAIKQATMQQLLTGKTRLPAFSGEWETKPVSELIVDGPRNGYSPSSGAGARGTLTLRLAATTSGRLILNESTVKRLSEEIARDSELFLRTGDVLVQRSNTLDLVGTTVYFDGPSDTYVYPDLLIRLRFREEATARWFCCHANSAEGRSFFMGGLAPVWWTVKGLGLSPLARGPQSPSPVVLRKRAARRPGGVPSQAAFLSWPA